MWNPISDQSLIIIFLKIVIQIMIPTSNNHLIIFNPFKQILNIKVLVHDIKILLLRMEI
jgi:hypothetical protein